jgi:pyruvate/2-oxoacid:ferredoxin oxidoreductase beta subunit
VVYRIRLIGFVFFSQKFFSLRDLIWAALFLNYTFMAVKCQRSKSTIPIGSATPFAPSGMPANAPFGNS